ncbi:histidine kinase [Streptomyces lucensis JCM 4490]|uniref:histidine kinase n=1 Tax=Streptomyces lucensis JCM 4490 TaxID=1306176 RepID=A0A918MT96_9ACTN|nr:SpoIIE family protein phosphatase [Streptomyces lucensis]GGW60530.1 histidine kinase [Streptomyces lucensis JCM 4490]
MSERAGVGAGGDARRTAGTREVFADGGRTGADLAAVDWAATPLGPPDRWPQSLRTAVSIMLSSRFPMWMAWGPDLTFFCNAAYRRDTLGLKYPWALGRPAREVWAEIWPDIGPRIERVLGTGEATWDDALLLFLERSGYPEETYHTFSYSPLRDDDAQVVGMLCVVSEDTDRVVGERRMATLRDLGSDPTVVRTEEETLAFACRQLARNARDLPFTLTYLFAPEEGARLAGSTGLPPGHPAAPAVLPEGATGLLWPAAAAGSGESVCVPLTDDRFGTLPAGDWPEPPTEALVVPLQQQGGEPYGFLVAALNRYRPLDDAYRGFIGLTATHLASGIGSARSYRAQQRRAEELAELDRAKTTFFSNISHEFRTPLTLMTGPAQELLTRLADAEPSVRQDLEAIHRNGLRLGKLVNTLLDFSRIEAGRMQARYEPVDLAAVTAELASVFRSAVDRAGLAFHVDCAPLPQPVHIDRGMWEKVVLNLLSNALKFTFDGTVTVTVRERDDAAEVLVADTGTGVPAAEMPRLFERFHRISGSRARSNEGSGIGLALVRELVLLHGGTITADSEEGKGTCFTVRLPFGTAHLPADAVVAAGPHVPAVTAAPYVLEALRWLPENDTAAQQAGVGTAPAAPPAPQTAGKPAHVLIADDNTDMREYLTRLLTQAGYRVSAVADGDQALRAVRGAPPDLIVSDVMMPRVDGLSLLNALRTDSRTASLPVLLLSARAGQEAAIEGLRAGADDYLVKPFAAAELLARVRANVELARLRGHHVRWRTALVDSLQEAFFVCDGNGAVIEINAAFSDILGYGPEGLPYRPVHPWWPDAAADPDGHRAVADALTAVLRERHGIRTVPVVHRDGRRRWIAVSFTRTQDPDTGRRVIVGTFRDVTTEHYAVQRESALAALGTRLSRVTSLTDTLAAALDQLRELWRADSVMAVVLGSGDRPSVTATTPADWQELPEPRRRAITELHRRPLLTSASDATGGGILLEHPEGPMALWVETGRHRPFGDEDQLLLAVLAGQLAQALARAHQFDQQRVTALALQRAILGPSELPGGFAVRYEPATPPLEVGGDWYDTIALPDGRIGIVVGDCVGRGLEAAAVMGQLRSACRALFLQDTGPGRTLAALDHFATGVAAAVCTTVFCGVLDPGSGVLTYASAGHPPGILAGPDGATKLLEEGRSLPLGVRPGRVRPEATTVLPVRSTLLLYTDGLVERRRQALSTGIRRACDALVAGGDVPLQELAAHVTDRLAPQDGFEDDVALLLYRYPAPLTLSFPARPGQLAPVRHALRTWLENAGLAPKAAMDVLMAAGEACANAVEHGHRDAPGASIGLRAEASAHRVRLTVADSGRWKEPQPEANPLRGRGISLMRKLMDHVTIEPAPAGTTVDMHTRIR